MKLASGGTGLPKKPDSTPKNGGPRSEVRVPAALEIIPSADPINKKKPTPKNTPMVAVATSMIEARYKIIPIGNLPAAPCRSGAGCDTKAGRRCRFRTPRGMPGGSAAILGEGVEPKTSSGSWPLPLPSADTFSIAGGRATSSSIFYITLRGQQYTPLQSKRLGENDTSSISYQAEYYNKTWNLGQHRVKIG